MKKNINEHEQTRMMVKQVQPGSRDQHKQAYNPAEMNKQE
jgi:hypothetical protein